MKWCMRKRRIKIDGTPEVNPSDSELEVERAFEPAPKYLNSMLGDLDIMFRTNSRIFQPIWEFRTWSHERTAAVTNVRTIGNASIAADQEHLDSILGVLDVTAEVCGNSGNFRPISSALLGL